MNYVISCLLVILLSFLIYKNVKTIIEKVKEKKQQKAENSDVIENNEKGGNE